MTTLAWFLAFAGGIVIRQSMRGRGLSTIPEDVASILIGIVTGNRALLDEALARKDDPLAAFNDDGASAPTTAPAAPSSGDVKSQADLIALGTWMQGLGYRVSEGPPPFGPIGRHSPTGHHYKVGETGVRGLALDVNWPNAAAEPANLDRLARMLVGQGWRVTWRTTGHYDHLHVDTGGPAGMRTL